MFSARDLTVLPVFVAVARSGSFTVAARELRLSKSVVSQHVRRLEERCGARLLERTTRQVHVTQVGERVLDAAKLVLHAVETLDQVARGEHDNADGTLRVALPNDGALIGLVSSIAAELMRQHPALHVDLTVSDTVQDLVEAGLDVALRLGRLRSSSYVVNQLGSEPEIIVSSSSVFVELSKAQNPRDLAGVPWIAHSALGVRSTLSLRSDDGRKVQIAVDVRATANTGPSVRDLVLAGAGLAFLPAHLVRDDLKEGRLVHLCRRWFHQRLKLHALTPTKKTPRRVQLFLSALRDAAGSLGFERS